MLDKWLQIHDQNWNVSKCYDIFDQVSRKYYSQKVDIYALGIIKLLHPMATGMERIKHVLPQVPVLLKIKYNHSPGTVDINFWLALMGVHYFDKEYPSILSIKSIIITSTNTVNGASFCTAIIDAWTMDKMEVVDAARILTPGIKLKSLMLVEMNFLKRRMV
ncbi:hypothetical protein TrispH2_010794 [Trichoplax sp. H2]|nr:hypothetical protein TrispH2_010794 [Trichoplax sp. H2]|eukprot:RDD36692.1 hypothetical protein TrispH2_010794 [Trichoplax sp. H2]